MVRNYSFVTASVPVSSQIMKQNLLLSLLVVFSLVTIIGCTKKAPPPPPPPSSLLDVTVTGLLTDGNGLPVQNTPITATTERSSQTVFTNSKGLFAVEVVQAPREFINFEFLNAIGDTAYFRRRFKRSGQFHLNVKMDAKGTLVVE